MSYVFVHVLLAFVLQNTEDSLPVACDYKTADIVNKQ